jgi:hypothetical protein
MLTSVFAQRVGSGAGPNANDKGLGLAAASLVGLGFRRYGPAFEPVNLIALRVRAMIDRPERGGSH